MYTILTQNPIPNFSSHSFPAHFSISNINPTSFFWDTFLHSTLHLKTLTPHFFLAVLGLLYLSSQTSNPPYFLLILPLSTFSSQISTSLFFLTTPFLLTFSSPVPTPSSQNPKLLPLVWQSMNPFMVTSKGSGVLDKGILFPLICLCFVWSTFSEIYEQP